MTGKKICAKAGIRLWLETDEGVLVGKGRMELLGKVDELGSIKKAAEAMNMSYRAAWGKIKKTEGVLGEKIVDVPGGNRKGCSLTPMGRELLASFTAWQERVLEYAKNTADEFFPWMAEKI